MSRGLVNIAIVYVQVDFAGADFGLDSASGGTHLFGHARFHGVVDDEIAQFVKVSQVLFGQHRFSVGSIEADCFISRSAN